MTKRQVIVELKPNSSLISAATTNDPEAKLAASAVPKISKVNFDNNFSVTPLPQITTDTGLSIADVNDDGVRINFDETPATQSYIVRAEIEEKDVDEVVKNKSVIGVYSDVQIQPQVICPGSPALGDDGDVEKLLCVDRLNKIGGDGAGVLVAIVDSGINMAHLNSKGKTPGFDATRSWVPQPGLIPGELPVGHGSMCAFDACIAAPECTLLDIALLQSTASGQTIMSGFLSDAVKAYSHLYDVMTAPRRPGETRSLVVNNSWGMFHPSWDFPVGHPGNYSDNPNHPFNRIVATLARVGADILFAAGNCGSNCPDGRCQGVTSNAIYGANSHKDVLSVAGVDTTKQRVGYSSQGPGRLTHNKPDISGYTHFRGSDVYPADGGTSAATPVVAGVLAAIRSKRPYESGNPARSPSAIRELVITTAEDLGSSGYDFDHGYGVVDGCEIARKLNVLKPIDICKIFPSICRIRRVPIDICKRYPRLCKPFPEDDRFGILDLGADPKYLVSLDTLDLVELIYYVGQFDAKASDASIGNNLTVEKKSNESAACCCTK